MLSQLLKQILEAIKELPKERPFNLIRWSLEHLLFPLLLVVFSVVLSSGFEKLSIQFEEASDKENAVGLYETQVLEEKRLKLEQEHRKELLKRRDRSFFFGWQSLRLAKSTPRKWRTYRVLT